MPKWNLAPDATHSVLATNTEFILADSLLSGKAPLNAYTLLDLADATDALVLSEKVYVMPYIAYHDYPILDQFRKEGILKELPLPRHFEAQIHNIRGDGPIIADREFIDGAARLFHLDRPPIVDGNYSWRTPGRDVLRWFQQHSWPDEEIPREEDAHFRKTKESKKLAAMVGEFVLRTDLYVRASLASGIPLYPDSLRSTLLRTRFTERYVASFRLGRSVIEKFEKVTEKQSKQWNSMLGQDVFELRKPMVLATILRKCESPKDIPKAILELRNSSGARAFRAKCKQTVDAVNSEDTRLISELNHQIMAEKGKIEMKGFVDQNEELMVRIIPHIVTTPSKIRDELTTRTVGWLFRRIRRKHIVFLTGLQNTCMELGRMNAKLNKIFGKELSERELEVLSDIRQLDKGEKKQRKSLNLFL
jgi:hypothetical protein